MWWLPLLLWALGKLLEFLLSRSALSYDEKAKVERVVYKLNNAKSRAVALGCNPFGREE
jgi:hypothetical protein